MFGTSAFASTPIPNDVHFLITGISSPVSTAAGGSNIAVTVSVYEANADVIGTSQLEDQHSLPAAFPFTFTPQGGAPVTETGVMTTGASGLNPQVPQPGNQWTYTYMVPTPAVAQNTNYTVSGGSGQVPANLTDAQLANYPPFMIHWSANTSSSYGQNGKLSVNQWQDTDDPIFGSASLQVQLTPPPTNNMPEVPFAAALPALLAVGGLGYAVRRARRGKK